jgi:uncharacterized protein YbaR (Trm112 family)
MITEELLDLLVCPICRDKLVIAAGQGGLVCRSCSLMYPVRDGIPVLLADEAEAIGTPESDVPCRA